MGQASHDHQPIAVWCQWRKDAGDVELRAFTRRRPLVVDRAHRVIDEPSRGTGAAAVLATAVIAGTIASSSGNPIVAPVLGVNAWRGSASFAMNMESPSCGYGAAAVTPTVVDPGRRIENGTLLTIPTISDSNE